MRRAISFFLWLVLTAPLSAQTTVTIRQLETFLLSRDTQKQSDSTLAKELASLQLSEQLDEARLANLATHLRLEPQASEQLELLAAASLFEPPSPAAEVEPQSPPDAREQTRILDSARTFADSFARHLPDFLALRSTRSYNNAPQPAGKKHPPEIRMHYVGARRRQVTVQAGQEVAAAPSASNAPDSDHAEGMTTWGEFGPLIATILGDTQAGSIAWSRWQTGALGRPLAVFRYSVPKPASHNLIDLDAQVTMLNNPRAPQLSVFHDHPAYHGDLYIDPVTGAVVRVTLDAELAPSAPVVSSRLAVEYAPVEIGGNSYICPVRGVAVSVVHNAEMEAIEGGGPERFINLVSFTQYHKFGSTARIVNDK